MPGIKARIGQSMLEYVLIMLLVATAILAMRKYVIRGVMGGIKSWEDQVNESLTADAYGWWVFVSRRTVERGILPFPPAECSSGVANPPNASGPCTTIDSTVVSCYPGVIREGLGFREVWILDTYTCREIAP